MNDLVDISPDHLKVVQDILRENLPSGVAVWAFGSRASWATSDSSDLDLALEGDIDHDTILALEMAFEESRLPYTVDIIDLNQVSDSFRRIVDAQKIPLADADKPRNSVDQWPRLQFGDCVNLVRDTVLPTDLDDVPYIDLEHMGEGTLSLVGCGNASDVSSITGRFRRGDILFGKLRPYLRKMIRADFDGVCSTDIWVVRPTTKTDADYLFYLMASKEFVDVATRGSEGTKTPRAKWEWISRYEIPIPPLSDQRTIAHILRTLDAKIELNRRMNQTLEEMARALFKSWFVDFDPVRAKMDGRWLAGESLLGLPACTYNLFPDKLVDSEMGEIPNGWEVTSLRHYAMLNPESWSRTSTPKEVEYIDLTNVKSGVIKSTHNYLWKNAPSSAQRILQPGDTIVGTVRPGNKSYALIGESGLTGSTGFVVLRPLRPEYRELVYLASTAPNNIKYLAHRADGATVRPKVVSDTGVAVPPADKNVEILNQFSNIIAPIVDKMLSANSENNILATQRDTLLPKIMSGKIQVTAMVQRRHENDLGQGLWHLSR